MSAPVFIDGKFQGMVGESFELSTISGFLKSIQISRNCETYILDTEGNIVVSTGPNNGYKLEQDNLVKQNALQAAGQAVEQAVQIRHSTSNRQFEFRSPATNEVYLAQFTPFPNKFNKNWEVLTLAPVSDFMVGLNEINLRLMIYGGLGCLLLVFLTFIGSRTISRPIEHLTQDIRNLLAFDNRKTVIQLPHPGDHDPQRRGEQAAQHAARFLRPARPRERPAALRGGDRARGGKPLPHHHVHRPPGLLLDLRGARPSQACSSASRRTSNWSPQR